MPSVQVRDLPDHLYNQINYLAKQEHRSLAQQTVVLLKEGIEKRISPLARRQALLHKLQALDMRGESLPDAVTFIREDRER